MHWFIEHLNGIYVLSNGFVCNADDKKKAHHVPTDAKSSFTFSPSSLCSLCMYDVNKFNRHHFYMCI